MALPPRQTEQQQPIQQLQYNRNRIDLDFGLSDERLRSTLSFRQVAMGEGFGRTNFGWRNNLAFNPLGHGK